MHRVIPEELARELRRAGVLRWEIWADGETLFHRVETVDGYARAIARLEALDPGDHPERAAFDAVIRELASSEPADDVMLRPVWMLDRHRQGAIGPASDMLHSSDE